MTEQNPEDLEARFRLDQEEAATEQEERHAIVWAHQVRDADTTMDQREAITRRVNAQAALMEALETVLWITVAAAVLFGAGLAIGALVRLFQ